jgi:hypothetical protein
MKRRQERLVQMFQAIPSSEETGLQPKEPGADKSEKVSEAASNHRAGPGLFHAFASWLLTHARSWRLDYGTATKLNEQR